MPSTAKNPRVRFAPSPTGYLHVGGARTALFNWLFARHFGGALILRIEDTDFERSSQEMVQGILDGMRWMGLEWDEGPFFQSGRLDTYREMAELLLKRGKAYPCFCGKEELEERRRQAAAQGRPPMYDRRCRSIDASAAASRRQAGEPCALRFAIPDGGATSFEDAVFGHLEFANAEIEDFVLLRSDGIPTYHLSVVADDLDMDITHVIRGADHISNTPKQVLQYRALGRELPVFAHVPLILGPDKSRLSKRHGATSVLAYREMGIVPEAFRNFLALLGWSPGGAGKDANQKDREIFDSAELAELFTLDGIARSNAVFDNDKLAWFNAESIRRYPPEKLLPFIEEEWAKSDFRPSRGRQEALAAIELLQPRARNPIDFNQAARAYFSEEYSYDPGAVAKFLSDRRTGELLAELAGQFKELSDFSQASTERVLRAFAEARGVKAGALINGSRVALTGQAVAPSLFAVMEFLGRERVVRRLRAAVSIPSAETPAQV